MKIKKLIGLILILIFLGISISFLTYFLFIIDAIRIIPMDVEFTDYTFGMNGDTDAFHFGKVALFTGAYATKFMRVGNYKSHPSLVSITFSGDLADSVKVSDNNFILQPGEEKELKFKAYVPDGAEQGIIYTGKAKIVIKRFFS